MFTSTSRVNRFTTSVHTSAAALGTRSAVRLPQAAVLAAVTLAAFAGASLPAFGHQSTASADVTDVINQLPYQPVSPSRVATAKLGPGATYTLALANVPAGATYAQFNVAASRATESTTLSVCPGATATTGCTTVLATAAGPTKSVGFSAQLGGATGNQVTFKNSSGTMDIYVDLHGFATSADSAGPTDAFFKATALTKVLDDQLVGPRASQVVTLPNVPAGATAVSLSLSATNATTSSYVAVCPADQLSTDCAKTSELLPAPGVTPTNSVVIKLGGPSLNQVKLYNNAGSSAVDASVAGYFVVPTVPGASNTGVPAGKTLTTFNGDMTVTTPNTVIDGLDIHGFLTINAANVTVKNSIIRGGSTVGSKAVVRVTGGSLNLQDSEISPTSPSVALNGVSGSNYTLRRVDIHGTTDGARIKGDNVVIDSSWVHDLVHYLVDPDQSGGPSHDDGVQIEAGNNITIANNSISGAHNAAIMVVQGVGTIGNLKLQSNYFDGGGCSINFAEYGKGPFAGLVVTNNRFGRNTQIVPCPMMAPTTTIAVMTATGNVYDDNNAPAVIRKG